MSRVAQSLEEMARRRLQRLDEHGLRRSLGSGDRRRGIVIERDGTALVSFCCNDYLNLSQHPRVVDAAIEATRSQGAGAGASRLVTGNHPGLPALERRLAALKETEDAVVFGSGYLANLGIIPALVSGRDLILVDELAHSCLLAGAALSGARVLRFRHNDCAALAALLDAHRGDWRHCLVLTEGVFSMDGDLAPLPELAALCADRDAWLLVDDAHGLGVVGGGRGSALAFGPVAPQIPLQMGTLSKAAGAYGGYVCTSRAVADLIRNRARTLIYTTGLPPGTVAAADTALQIIAEDTALTARPLAQAQRFCRLAGLPAPVSPIVPLRLGHATAALAASRLLEETGLLVTAIRPPTVPRGSARLRFTFTAAHTHEQIARLAEAVATRILPREMKNP